jgi:predicted Abi (CAAX) family protease
MTGGAAAMAALTIALYPAFSEELLFRVMLLPRSFDRSRRPRAITVASLALLAYVAAHPLNAALFRPELFGLFSNPFYLALTALLGIACTAAYFASGSIWPPVLMHWVTVMLWILGLGGQAQIQSALAQ